MNKPCKCGSVYIVNNTYNLCDACNYYRLHGKTRFEVAREKESTKPRKIYYLKRSPVRSTKRTKEKRVEILSKDRELYLYIFNTKLPICEECSNKLPDVFEDKNGDIFCIGQYSHILGKGAYPEFRHNKLNMNRLCYHCHDKWEFGAKEGMKIYEGNQVLIEKMKDDYNNLK